VHVFDGKRLVIGDRDYYGFSIGDDGRVTPLWNYKAPKDVTASVFNADGLRYAIGEVDGTLRLMKGGGQAGGYISPGPGGAIVSLDAISDFSRIAFATATGYVGVLDNGGSPQWQARVAGPAVIRFAGADGRTVVGDGRGFVRWFDPTGRETRSTNLTDLVWRDDIESVLTSPDPTPVLRVGPSPAEQEQPAVPEGVPNLAASAKFSYVPARSWWNERIHPDRSVLLNDGAKTSPPGGWYDRTKLEYLAFVPSPPGWVITWEKPVTVDTLVVYESADVPEAVPQEVRIEAWIDDNWREVAHSFWNRKTPHVHRFGRLETTKLRYTPVGDLANGVYLAEIEACDTAGK